MFSPQPDIQNLFHSPGKLHPLDKHKAIKRLPAAPVATVYPQAERGDDRPLRGAFAGKEKRGAEAVSRVILINMNDICPKYIGS